MPPKPKGRGRGGKQTQQLGTGGQANGVGRGRGRGRGGGTIDLTQQQPFAYYNPMLPYGAMPGQPPYMPYAGTSLLGPQTAQCYAPGVMQQANPMLAMQQQQQYFMSSGFMPMAIQVQEPEPVQVKMSQADLHQLVRSPRLCSGDCVLWLIQSMTSSEPML